jgi:hypothetical protein
MGLGRAVEGGALKVDLYHPLPPKALNRALGLASTSIKTLSRLSDYRLRRLIGVSGQVFFKPHRTSVDCE